MSVRQRSAKQSHADDVAALRASLERHAHVSRAFERLMARRSAAVAPTSVMMDVVPEEGKEPKRFKRSLLYRVDSDVPPDGSCLFHSLQRSLNSAKWLPNSTYIQTARDMRVAIATYLLNHPEKFQEQHEPDIVARAAQIRRLDAKQLSYEQAMPIYYEWLMDDDTWGGYPEMDAAATMLGVVVHNFVVPSNGRGHQDAVLAASFFPSEVHMQDAASSRELTKFLMLWEEGHFSYARPLEPGELQRNVPAEQTASERAAGIRILKQKPGDKKANANGSDYSQSNRTLKDAHESAKAREKAQSDAREVQDACRRGPVELTREQKGQVALSATNWRTPSAPPDTSRDKAIAEELAQQMAEEMSRVGM